MGSLTGGKAGRWSRLPAVLAGVAAAAALAGCASPGLPRPPSLQLPAAVDNLAATRRGGAVELRFALPSRTTDGFALKPGTLSAELCRALDAGPCLPLAGVPAQTFPVPAAGTTAFAELRDILPPALANGVPRLLTYRVELANNKGRSGGFSSPAFAASGNAPQPVMGLAAQGSRLGTVLTWTGDAEREARVVLRREGVQAADAAKTKSASSPTSPASPSRGRGHRGSAPEAAEPGVVWFDAHADSVAASGGATATLDTTAALGEEYRYTAERRLGVQVGGKALETRSEMSAPAVFTLRDVYPPPMPEELSVAGFVTPAAGSVPEAFAVDLIWKPVDDPHLAGYNVYRQAVDAAGKAQGTKARLNASLLTIPALHDAGATATQRYLYRVTAVDEKGNESSAAVVMLEPR